MILALVKRQCSLKLLLKSSQKWYEKFRLKGPCHEVFAVLGQFCAKIIT